MITSVPIIYSYTTNSDMCLAVPIFVSLTRQSIQQVSLKYGYSSLKTTTEEHKYRLSKHLKFFPNLAYAVFKVQFKVCTLGQIVTGCRAVIKCYSLSRKTVNTRENFWNIYCSRPIRWEMKPRKITDKPQQE